MHVHSIHLHNNVYICIHLCICTYTYMCTCMYVYIGIYYIHTYIHTCMHTYVVCVYLYIHTSVNSSLPLRPEGSRAQVEESRRSLEQRERPRWDGSKGSDLIHTTLGAIVGYEASGPIFVGFIWLLNL